MSDSRIVFLMYHELDRGLALCQSESGYVRYVLTLASFRSQMEWLKRSAIAGLSVSAALAYPSGANVCITFDDGCETDWTAAAPVLREFGLHATFYVTAGRVGTAGYMSEEQVRELDAQGFEIGCHSMTHPYLCDLGEADLKRETVDAKNRIEQIVGHEIEHFSCPGGRYDERTLEMARRAGFKSAANSEFHANTRATDRYRLGRIAMLRDLTIDEFGVVCRGRGFWKKRLSHGIRRGAQLVLGNKQYDRIRAALLGEPRS